MSYQHLFARVLTIIAAASLLAACQGGSGTAPAIPGQAGLIAPRSLSSSAKSAAAAGSVATPSSLHFTADQAGAQMAQTVTISAKSAEKLYVSVTGTGDCPAVSPSQLQPKNPHNGQKTKTAVLTVTPIGGAADCTIRISDRDEIARGQDCDDETILIPVSIDPEASPTPIPCSRYTVPC